MGRLSIRWGLPIPLEIEEKIDEAIKNRNKNNDGVDISLIGSKYLCEDICKLYTVEGNVMTAEAFSTSGEDWICYCWAETAEKHKAWIDAH